MDSVILCKYKICQKCLFNLLLVVAAVSMLKIIGDKLKALDEEVCCTPLNISNTDFTEIFLFSRPLMMIKYPKAYKLILVWHFKLIYVIRWLPRKRVEEKLKPRVRFYNLFFVVIIFLYVRTYVNCCRLIIYHLSIMVCK